MPIIYENNNKLKWFYKRLLQKIHPNMHLLLNKKRGIKLESIYKHHQPPFEQILLETVNICNNTCSFCPININSSKRKYNLMPWNIIEKVAEDLEQIKYNGRISLYCNNEPLIDHRMEEIISLFSNKCPNSRINISTNGLLINAKRVQRFFDNGLTKLEINNYNTKMELISPISKFIRESPNYSFYYNKAVKVIFRWKFEILDNRAGSSPNKQKIPIDPINKFCEFPFKQMIVVWTGDVPLCCFDVDYKVILGNVLKKSLHEIWHNSKNLKYIRNALLNHNRNCSEPCKICDHQGYKGTSFFK